MQELELKHDLTLEEKIEDFISKEGENNNPENSDDPLLD